MIKIQIISDDNARDVRRKKKRKIHKPRPVKPPRIYGGVSSSPTIDWVDVGLTVLGFMPLGRLVTIGGRLLRGTFQAARLAKASQIATKGIQATGETLHSFGELPIEFDSNCIQQAKVYRELVATQRWPNIAPNKCTLTIPLRMHTIVNLVSKKAMESAYYWGEMSIHRRIAKSEKYGDRRVLWREANRCPDLIRTMRQRIQETFWAKWQWPNARPCDRKDFMDRIPEQCCRRKLTRTRHLSRKCTISICSIRKILQSFSVHATCVSIPLAHFDTFDLVTNTI